MTLARYGRRLLCLSAAFAGLSAALIVASPYTAIAEDAQEMVYVVDMQRVLNESILGKAARKNLEKDVQKTQGKLESLKQEIVQLRAALEKQAALLSKEALQDKSDALDRKQKELARLVQDQREEISRKNAAEMKKVVTEIDKVIAELAKEEKYRFVIERDERFVVYADNDLDLTDEVISILDDKKVGL